MPRPVLFAASRTRAVTIQPFALVASQPQSRARVSHPSSFLQIIVFLLMPSIKPRPTPPLGYTGRVPTLLVRHPHYRDYNTLLKLPALDEGDTVHYNVALIICGIISDNSWETGWFARASDGSSVCEPDVPLAASDGDVFYFVNDPSCKRQCAYYSKALLTSLSYGQIPSLSFVGSVAPP